MRRLSAALAVLFASALGLAGCGPAAPKAQSKAKVSGTITFDKKNLPTGKITFDAANGQPPSEFDILDGKYEGEAPVGECKVMISSFEKKTMKEKTGRDGPGYDQLSEFNVLPDRYNLKSAMKREVKADGANVHNFDLEKK